MPKTACAHITACMIIQIYIYTYTLQDRVDSADELPQVLEQFNTWLHSQGLFSDGIKFAVVTW
jgi:hypothetical protein